MYDRGRADLASARISCVVLNKTGRGLYLFRDNTEI
jgi:hypothetical protein